MSNKLFSLICESIYPTSREDFVDTWLSEMPMGIPSQNYYPSLMHNIKERIDAGLTRENVKSNLYRIVGPSIVHYWYEENNHIILGSEMDRKPQALVVNFTAKDPDLSKTMPNLSGKYYASNLYLDIVNTSHTPIRLQSDQSLSDEGMKIWKRLLSNGHKIVVYDTISPGANREVVSDLDHLMKYFSHGDPNFKKYQYALVKSGEILAETISMFNTRRFRELAEIL